MHVIRPIMVIWRIFEFPSIIPLNLSDVIPRLIQKIKAVGLMLLFNLGNKCFFHCAYLVIIGLITCIQCLTFQTNGAVPGAIMATLTILAVSKARWAKNVLFAQRVYRGCMGCSPL